MFDSMLTKIYQNPINREYQSRYIFCSLFLLLTWGMAISANFNKHPYMQESVQHRFNADNFGMYFYLTTALCARCNLRSIFKRSTARLVLEFTFFYTGCLNKDPVMLELWVKAEYPIIAIAPRSTVARSGSTQ